MASELYMIKTARGLVPAEPQDVAAYEAMEFNVAYKVVATRPRSGKRNRWFHALLNNLFKMQDTWPTFTLFKQAVKRALGLFEVYEVDGSQYFEYPSVAFDKMSEEDFKSLCDRLVLLICERIVPNLTEAEARRIFDIMDGNTAPTRDPRTDKPETQAA
jgi:hypothetical protein